MWFALQVCQAEASREGRHLEVNNELATQLCLGDTARELNRPSQALETNGSRAAATLGGWE
jgi:hypothetical protein